MKAHRCVVINYIGNKGVLGYSQDFFDTLVSFKHFETRLVLMVRIQIQVLSIRLSRPVISTGNNLQAGFNGFANLTGFVHRKSHL